LKEVTDEKEELLLKVKFGIYEIFNFFNYISIEH